MKLTKHEYTILQGLANGRNITEIAREMAYSRDWVSRLAANLYKKMGAKNAPQAVAIALREGLID